GHSERRLYRKETDEMINKKIRVALRAGLRVVLCVGEPETVRRRGITAAKSYVREQLHAGLKGVSARIAARRNLAVVYEPLWAISTSGSAMKVTPEQAVEMLQFMKATIAEAPLKLQARMIYGGSVDAGNALKFLQPKQSEGALVGADSLKAAHF